MPKSARAFVRRRGGPIVDQRPMGWRPEKGVVVAMTEDEAIAAIGAIMDQRCFLGTRAPPW